MTANLEYVIINLFRGWWIVPLAILAMALLLAFRWKRCWLGFMAAASGVVGILILALLPLTWSTMRALRLDSRWCWVVYTTVSLGSSHGTLDMWFGLSHVSRFYYLLDRVLIYNYPNSGPFRCSGITRYVPFLEDPVGLQIQPEMREDTFTHRRSYQLRIVMSHWLFMVLVCPWFPLLWYLRRRRGKKEKPPRAIGFMPEVVQGPDLR